MRFMFVGLYLNGQIPGTNHWNKINYIKSCCPSLHKSYRDNKIIITNLVPKDKQVQRLNVKRLTWPKTGFLDQIDKNVFSWTFSQYTQFPPLVEVTDNDPPTGLQCSGTLEKDSSKWWGLYWARAIEKELDNRFQFPLTKQGGSGFHYLENTLQ